ALPISLNQLQQSLNTCLKQRVARCQAIGRRAEERLPNVRRRVIDEFCGNGTLVSALQVPNRGKQQRTIEVYLALKERNEIKNRIVCTLLAGNVPCRSPTG